MTNLVPPLNVTLPEGGSTGSGVTAGIETPEGGMGNLNLGQQINLQIKPQTMQTLTGKLLVSIDLGGGRGENTGSANATVTMNLPPQVQLPEQASQIQARVVAKTPQRIDVRLISVDGQKVENFVSTSAIKDTISNTAAVVKTIGNLQDVALVPLRLQPLLARELSAMGVGSSEIRQLSNLIENLSLKPEIVETVLQSNTTVSPPPTTMAQSLPEVIRNLAATLKPLLETSLPQSNSAVYSNQPSSIDTKLSQGLPEKIIETIKNFFENGPSGREITAETSLRGDKVVLRTPLGEIIPEVPLKIAVGEKFILRFSELLGLEREPKINPKSEGGTAQSLGSKLNEILAPLQTRVAPKVYNAIIDKIPAHNHKMLSNIMTFLKAAGEGKVETWLGQDVVDSLRLSGPEGQKALARLEDMIIGRREDNTQWRIIEIPFYGAENLSRIQVAVRRFGKDGRHQQSSPKGKGAARFVVDTSFTALGGFQFDGFSLPQERRFDLIIRTEKEIDTDFCTEIMNLFRKSLSEVDYAGNIRINIKEKFIKLCDDEPEPPLLQDGIYI